MSIDDDHHRSVSDETPETYLGPAASGTAVTFETADPEVTERRVRTAAIDYAATSDGIPDVDSLADVVETQRKPHPVDDDGAVGLLGMEFTAENRPVAQFLKDVLPMLTNVGRAVHVTMSGDGDVIAGTLFVVAPGMFEFRDAEVYPRLAAQHLVAYFEDEHDISPIIPGGSD